MCFSEIATTFGYTSSMSWMLTWLALWSLALGVPNLLFWLRGITYQKAPWSFTLFFLGMGAVTWEVYHSVFLSYIADWNVLHIATFIGVAAVWFISPWWYRRKDNDAVTRWQYQLPKFSELLFQQIVFLGGLLTFGVSPFRFAATFFVMHLVLMVLMEWRFASLFVAGSLVGGMTFAYLHLQGMYGFIVACLVHVLFYIAFHDAIAALYVRRDSA
jgi:hypothetical protein